MHVFFYLNLLNRMAHTHEDDLPKSEEAEHLFQHDVLPFESIKRASHLRLLH